MNQKQTNKIIKILKEKGISFDPGLSDQEIATIQDDFGFHFPSDLQLLLQTALPVSPGFIHWRYGLNNSKAKAEIKIRLNGPKEGILFDIKNNDFWLDKWGAKPTRFEEQKAIAIADLAKQPKLVPIYSHRYIPSEPNEMGNPVFSVHQTDIIYYGFDLLDYFAHEFQFELPVSFGRLFAPKRIPFWSDMVDLNNGKLDAE